MTDRYPLRLGPFVVVAPLVPEAVPEIGLAFSRQGRRVRPCLLKQVRLAKSGSEDLQAAFQRASRLSHRLVHKNLARAFAVGRLEGRLFLAEGCRPGLLLSQIQGRPLPVPAAAYIAREIATALAFLHRFEDGGLFHRRLSPEHVHLGLQGEVKLLESPFAGSARIGEAPFARAMRPSLKYLPPEIGAGKSGDARSDLYMLGALLQEMLGAPPAGGAPSEHPEVPAPLQELITRLLAATPDDRPASALEVRRALGPFSPWWRGGRAALRRLLAESVDVPDLLDQLGRWQAAARALLPRARRERTNPSDQRPPPLWVIVGTIASRKRLLLAAFASLALTGVLVVWRPSSPAGTALPDPVPRPGATAGAAAPVASPPVSAPTVPTVAAPEPAKPEPDRQAAAPPPAALPLLADGTRSRWPRLSRAEARARGEDLVRGAEVRFQWRDFDGAERLLREALIGLPRNPRLHYLLGVVLLARGEAADAAAAFTRTVQLQPGYSDAARKLKIAQERASIK